MGFVGVGFALAGALSGCSLPPPSRPDVRFIRDIQALADEGRLEDPRTVGRLLDVHLTPSNPITLHGSTCIGAETPEVNESESTSYVPSSEFWFQTRPEGQVIVVPNMLVGTVRQTGKLILSYSVLHNRMCYPGWKFINTEMEITIKFDNVPSFSCITEDRLHDIFPLAERAAIATDGARPYFYLGRVSEHTGVSVRFDYVYGAKCLISVTLSQDFRYSLDFRGAQRKQKECRERRRTLREASPTGEVDEQFEHCGYWEFMPGGRRS